MGNQLKTIEEIDIKHEDFEFEYVEDLTKKLDAFDGNFNQSMINEVVLWKVGRYAKPERETFSLLNKIKNSSRKINKSLTQKVLLNLLKTNGFGLPMASTVLRFKNPKIYQIIDQRVYRLIMGKELKLSQSKSIKNRETQIDLYLEYLDELRNVCKNKDIDFDKSDRILYKVDKRVNSKIKIKY